MSEQIRLGKGSNGEQWKGSNGAMFKMTIVDSTMIPGHIFIIPGHKDVGETGRRGTIRTPDFSQPSDQMETNIGSSSRILMCYFYAHIFDSVFFVFFLLLL